MIVGLSCNCLPLSILVEIGAVCLVCLLGRSRSSFGYVQSTSCTTCGVHSLFPGQVVRPAKLVIKSLE